MSSKRRIWLTTTSSACWVRSGMSSRRASSTSTAAARAVIGERSSWLTSEAKRASRSIRVCTASAISLNEPANRSRSGSDSGARRVSSPPEAMSSAASATWLSGRSSRRLVARPNRVASSRVPAAPSVSAVRIEVSVRSVDRSGNASKYPVSCSAMATPTVMNSSPLIDANSTADRPAHTVSTRRRGNSVSGCVRSERTSSSWRGSEHGETVRLGAQVVLDEVADLDGIVRHHVTDVVGVLECLGLGGRGALVDEVVPGEAVGDPDQHDPRRAAR